jgi:lipopolysaccharide/colanic/teichoic acid biosynthesis glycosyltransferase
MHPARLKLSETSGKDAAVKSGHQVKRVIDLCLGTASLLITAIPMAVIWCWIRWESGPPAIFRQVRTGFRGQPFALFKFRTMRKKGTRGMHDGERLTRLGERLRRSSLDELPELVNVLKGDMSLVGPRPLLPRYLPRYTREQARRHEVKPGITGWAQVNGRNALTWEEKFELDVWYVDNWSLKLDAKILWMTLRQVLKGEGISAEGHATMPEFLGTPTTGETAQ